MSDTLLVGLLSELRH